MYQIFQFESGLFETGNDEGSQFVADSIKIFTAQLTPGNVLKAHLFGDCAQHRAFREKEAHLQVMLGEFGASPFQFGHKSQGELDEKLLVHVAHEAGRFSHGPTNYLNEDTVGSVLTGGVVKERAEK